MATSTTKLTLFHSIRILLTRFIRFALASLKMRTISLRSAQACLDIIPHKSFSFAKVWVMSAKCHVCRKDLGKARSILGRAIGVTNKKKIFDEYIALEVSERSERALMKTSTLAMNRHPRNGYRHNGYTHY